ncbi:TetR/AcrR family transcriptional regulator [Sphingomonas profundi]|uniref:TetR/AcrR family transcriptional regulator n=1 Tax=Alterirhizorhabdus profundi TaxID=2681549 RepID=UPI0018D06E85|nr:TetR/AcrR family transcriptional regulator [Sphingomonas profundi]
MNTPHSPSRGRPSKHDAKLLRQRIMAAALSEFRQRGFAGTSIDGIARVAAVSRTTIYALYSDKSTLFTEMIRGTIRIADIAGRVAFDDRPPALVLREAMTVLNGAYYREPNLEIVRLCIAEADRFPDLFEQVRDMLAHALTGLIHYFARMHAAGSMTTADSPRAALLFNMLALGSLKPFFVHQQRLTQDEIDGHIDLALDLFLRGCFVDAAKSGGAIAPQ